MKRESGTALITVLMIFAIAAFLATVVAEHQQMDIRRSANMISNDQAMQYALAAEELAKIVLIEDRLQDSKPKRSGNTEPVDGLGDMWNSPMLSTWKPIDAGQVRGKLYDLQGKFNINRLLFEKQMMATAGQMGPDGLPVQPAGAAAPTQGRSPRLQLQTLMDYFKVFPQGADLTMVQNFSYRVVDWVDSDNVPSGGDNEGEDDYYLGLQPAYKPRNNLFVDLSELRLLLAGAEVDEGQWQLFTNELAILPPNVPLNINTADQYVLDAVVSGGGGAQGFNAAEFVKAREANGGAFETFTDAEQKGNFPAAAADKCSLNTEYFLLRADAMVDGRMVHMDSVLYRPSAVAKSAAAQTNSDKSIKVIARKWVKYRPL
ncbi:MAG TPA: type II secretion system minor pseudopilin GspK [Pseudomonadales bacterium]|nr:type II secretion system minor pseudopilin GspK [Pseudomonadales bacterium]